MMFDNVCQKPNNLGAFIWYPPPPPPKHKKFLEKNNFYEIL